MGANDVAVIDHDHDHPVSLWLRNQTREATRSFYRRSLSEFATFVYGERLAVAGSTMSDVLLHVAFEDVLAYREWLTDPARKLRTSSVVAKMRVISAFYTHLTKRGLITANPFEPLTFPEVTDSKFKRAWRVAEIVAFMQAIAPSPTPASLAARVATATDVQAARDRALFWLLFRNGLRVSEACGARVGDLYEQDGATVLALREHGRDDQHVKGGKARVAVLKPETAETLNAYLALRGFRAGAEVTTTQDWRTLPLFAATRTSPGTVKALDRRTVLHLMHLYGNRAGLDPDLCHPHAARMTAITHLILAGVDLGSVMIFSGHASMASVQRYFDTTQHVQHNAAWKMPY